MTTPKQQRGRSGCVLLPQSVQSVCWLGFSRSRDSDYCRWGYGHVSDFMHVENDLRRVLCYGKINQIGFMVVGIGVGTELAIDGAGALLSLMFFTEFAFMSMGAVLFRTGGFEVHIWAGSIKLCPGRPVSVSLSSFHISFSFVQWFCIKSIIITETARNGHSLVWLCLLFASAGVFTMRRQIPFFAFAHDSGLRRRGPNQYAIGCRTALSFTFSWLQSSMAL